MIHPSRLLRRCLKIAGWTLAGILVLGILGTVIENWRGERAWAAYVSEAAARGEDLHPVATPPSALPDESNFAMAPIFQPLYDAAGHFAKGPETSRDPEKRKMLDAVGLNALAGMGKATEAMPHSKPGELADLDGWQRYFGSERAGKSVSPAEDVLTALAAYGWLRAGLLEACQRPSSAFPSGSPDLAPTERIYPHIRLLMKAGSILRLRACSELRLGHSTEALEDANILFRSFEALQAEPSILPMLVRVTLLDLLDQVIWEGLALHAWTESELKTIDSWLSSVNCASEFQAAVRSEKTVFFLPSMAAFQKDPSLMVDAMRAGPEPHGEKAVKALWKVSLRLIPRGWYLQNMSSTSRMHDRALTLVDPVHGTFMGAKSEGVLQTRKTPYTYLSSSLPSILINLQKKAATVQETLNLERIAVALERSRLLHGQLSDSLAGIDPSVAPHPLPTDVFNGSAAHYSAGKDGRFILYFDAWNEVDDGGKAETRRGREDDITKLDWVWPQLRKE